MSGSSLRETNPVLQIYEAQAIIVERDQEIERLRQENERLRMENYNRNQLELAQKVERLERDLASKVTKLEEDLAASNADSLQLKEQITALKLEEELAESKNKHFDLINRLLSLELNVKQLNDKDKLSQQNLFRTFRLTTMNVESPFFDRLPQETTIVLLSETGTGKSTFINSIINYLLYETLNEAIDEGVQILIRTCFSHTSDHIPQIRIDLPANLFTDSTTGNDMENEFIECGRSSILAPRPYVFKFGPAENEKKITIIDTPGIGDVRGLQKKDFRNTLAFLSKYRSINAFCILLKPNISTMTVSFRYCINGLLSALHVSVTNNILFCLTNTRATNYRIGETIPTLKIEMKKLKEKRGITIPINRETVFCFENDCYRLLCELKYGINYSKETIDSFSPSWNHSMAETFRMFEQIIKLRPYEEGSEC